MRLHSRTKGECRGEDAGTSPSGTAGGGGGGGVKDVGENPNARGILIGNHTEQG